MLRIFICYGKKEGEQIGNSLRRFLRNQGLEAFLASPKSPDIPAGIDFKKCVEAQLLQSHLLVPICNSGIHKSQPALEEIRLAINNEIPIVAFVKKKCRLPDLIKGKWEPIRFDPVFLESDFERLLIEIYRRIDWEREQSENLNITTPQVLLIFKGLKKLLRR